MMLKELDTFTNSLGTTFVYIFWMETTLNNFVGD